MIIQNFKGNATFFIKISISKGFFGEAADLWTDSQRNNSVEIYFYGVFSMIIKDVLWN